MLTHAARSRSRTYCGLIRRRADGLRVLPSATVSGRICRAIRGHLVPRSAPVDPTGGPTGEGREKVAGGNRRRKPAASDVVHMLGEFGRSACGARGGWLGLRQTEVTCPECRGRGA